MTASKPKHAPMSGSVVNGGGGAAPLATPESDPPLTPELLAAGRGATGATEADAEEAAVAEAIIQEGGESDAKTGGEGKAQTALKLRELQKR